MMHLLKVTMIHKKQEMYKCIQTKVVMVTLPFQTKTDFEVTRVFVPILVNRTYKHLAKVDFFPYAASRI